MKKNTAITRGVCHDLTMYAGNAYVGNVLLSLCLFGDAVWLLTGLRVNAAMPADVLTVGGFTYLGYRVLNRVRANRVSVSVKAILIAWGGTCFSLLYFAISSNAVSSTTPWSLLVQLIASLGFVWTAITLGGNFAVLPSVRTLTTHGPYRIVRHPMYAFYLLYDSTHMVDADSLAAAVIWAGELGLLYWRATMEEDVLRIGSAEYQLYCDNVPFKLIPGVI